MKRDDGSDEGIETRRLLRIWLGLGLQSFGGGAATLALIRRAVVEQRNWISPEEFARDWALVQLAPGINLLALTILIGRRLAGLKGVAIALFGLLLPSVTVTILATACYAHFQHARLVQAAIRGVIPASVGLGLLTAFQIARPPLVASRREGRASLLVSVGLLLASGLIAAAKHPSVILVLGAAGAIGALANWRRHAR